MAAAHLQGQDVSISVKVGGKVVAALAAVQNFEMTINVAAQELMFLGERGPRVDMVYNGVTFGFEVRHRSSGFHTFADYVKRVAQHRLTNVQFSLNGTILYPTGEKVKFTIQDAGFDTLPFNVGAQNDFVSSRISGKAQDIRVFGAAAL
jgi:hypothetical protein